MSFPDPAVIAAMPTKGERRGREGASPVARFEMANVRYRGFDLTKRADRNPPTVAIHNPEARRRLIRLAPVAADWASKHQNDARLNSMRR